MKSVKFSKQKSHYHEKLDYKIDRDSSPLITIITSTYNAAQTLPDTIASIRAQTYGNIEYIVVDGASTDHTLDVLRRNEDVIDYWLSEPDNGIYEAWNKGLHLSRGDWIAFLGSGDIYMSDAIEGYVALISRYVDNLPQYISSRAILTNGPSVLRAIGEPWNWKSFRRYMNVAHVGSLHHKSLFQQYGSFDVSYKMCGDYEFLLRPRENLNALYLNMITVNMTLGGVTNSSTKVFNESMRAKNQTGGRVFWKCWCEKYLAICKWIFKRYYFDRNS